MAHTLLRPATKFRSTHMIGFLILGMLTFAALYLLTNVLDRV